MKKVWLMVIPLVILVIVAALVFGITKWFTKSSNLTKIKVAEVTHSIFYAPQYAADALGYFEDEGLDIELLLVPGVIKKREQKKNYF